MWDILIYQEFTCNYYQYYTRNMKSMHEHFSNKYHELKASENNQEYIIQMSFRIELWKYIQVNKFDNKMMRKDDKNNDKEWNKILEKEFKKNIEWINISKNNKYDDFQLMKVFIIRIRWDIAIKDMNKKIFIEIIVISNYKISQK